MKRGTLRRSLFGTSWSAIAPERSRRPRAHQTSSSRSAVTGGCPFCEGHESETEPEVFAIRDVNSAPNGPGWSIRVVRNKYPALIPGPDGRPSSSSRHDHPLSFGFHEVVIDTPRHDVRLGELSVTDLTRVLGVYRSRVDILGREPGIRHVALFRNDGAAAGASQEHAHSQILATPILPSRVEHELAEASAHMHTTGECLTCASLDAERAEAVRLVAENHDFVALTAFAPRFSYEMWIAPRIHASCFDRCDDQQLGSLGSILNEVLGALDETVGEVPFNLIFQSVHPFSDPFLGRASHWRLEILPRLAVPSGLELGSDLFIVSVDPEEAAAALRIAASSEKAAIGKRPPS
jgi:UDPglucose--hexose-1-phosphate uridylyltransferase